MAVFEKSERLRHIGHLDIQRAVMRALRRSGLPVSYSNGFNPHILLTFASALSTGAAGRKEIMDVQLEREVSPEEFVSAMNGAMPPDMQLSFAKIIDDKHIARYHWLTPFHLVAAHEVADLAGGRTSENTRSGGSTNRDSTTKYRISDLFEFVNENERISKVTMSKAPLCKGSCCEATEGL